MPQPRREGRRASAGGWERPRTARHYPQDAMSAVKQLFIDRGAFSGRAVARIVRNFDDGDGKITKSEFAAGMLQYLGFPLHDQDIDAIFSQFDQDGDGSIDVEEFVLGLRGALPTMCWHVLFNGEL